MPGGLALRGGYAGLNAPDPNARDFKLYQSVLSGDLLGNDGPPGTFQNYQDNTKRIMHVLGTDVPTIVEGLAIRGGDGLDTPLGFPQDVGGGGLYCISGTLTIKNCLFEANQAKWGGLDLWSVLSHWG